MFLLSIKGVSYLAMVCKGRKILNRYFKHRMPIFYTLFISNAYNSDLYHVLSMSKHRKKVDRKGLFHAHLHVSITLILIHAHLHLCIREIKIVNYSLYKTTFDKNLYREGLSGKVFKILMHRSFPPP